MNDIKGSTILVTGGAGFVGSFIVEQLLEQDVGKIVIIDNMIRGCKENIAASLSRGTVELIEGDIRDQQLIADKMRGIDYCFHLAALRITQCAAEPRQALEVMYDGTFNVLEACAAEQIKKLIFSSTASVYGQADTFPTKESHPPYNNFTLYGAAKMANELMLKSFSQMHGLTYNALRYFNIYGPRMDTHGKYTEVLIRWYRLIKEGKSPIIFGDGKQTMDFVYVGEVARASICALTADVSNEVCNVASGIETSLEELCLTLLDVMGSDLKPSYLPVPDDRKKVEVMRRLADTSRAYELFDFRSQVDLKDGLTRLVAWLDAKEGG